MDKDDMSFEEWLEKESQAMNELYDGMEPAPQSAPAPAEEPSGETEQSAPETETGASPAEGTEPEKGVPAAEGEPAPAEEQKTAPEAEKENDLAGESAPAEDTQDEPEGPAFPTEEVPAEDQGPVRPQMTARMPPVDRTGASERAPRPEQSARMERDVPRRPARSAGEQTARQAAGPQRPPRPRRESAAPQRAVVEPPPGWEEKRGGNGGNDGGQDGAAGFWDKWKYALIAAAAVLLLAVGALAVSFGMASRVAKLTTIYPNVTMNGVPVGDMTLEEAAQVLGDPADRYDDAVVTVDFPTGDTLTVTAKDVGLEAIDGGEYARAAYSYGRGGSLLANWRTYRACKAEPVALTYGKEQAPITDEALTALVTPVAKQVNQKLGATQAKVEEDKITIVKRLGALEVDVPAVCALVREAFETENYEPIEYEMPKVSEGTDEQDVTALLQSLYEQVFVEPQNAQYDPATGGATESVVGVSFDPEDARQLWDKAKIGETVEIPLTLTEPDISTEQLMERLFADVLAEKSTTLAGSSGARINNITLAAKAMNGVVLQPGEQFDYNKCLGERTASRGYQSAGVYSNGQHETAIGGGICQGSSTLYYCALYANLKITVRYDHYFLVSYLPWGMDATVSWGGPDFKFINSRNYPIKIESYVSNDELTVKLLGTDEDGSYVKITSNTWEDEDYYYAQTYRKVYDKDGNELSSVKEAYSRYHKHEATTPTPAPTEPPAETQTQAPAPPPETQQTETPEATPTPTPEATPTPTPETPVEPEASPEGEA